MEVVLSNSVLRKFKNIRDFSMDFGISKTNEVKKEDNKNIGQITIKIKDPFIKRYSIEKGVFIMKTGNIGTLKFYLDLSLNSGQFIIYDENKEYEFNYTDTGDDRSYLSKILDQILENEIEPKNLDNNIEEEIKFELDKNLTQAEFIEKRQELKERMAKMNVNFNHQSR